MYEQLLFDADNTLFDFDAAEAQSLQSALTLTDLEYSAEILGVYQEINQRAWKAYEEGQLDKSQLRDFRFAQLIERYRCSGEADELSAVYREQLANSTQLLPGALEVLEWAADRFQLALVTNGLPEVQYPRLARTGLERFFSVVVVSEEIGAAKPQRAFFDHTFAALRQTSPQRVLVVGDNPIADIGGAMAYGCAACWLRRPGEHRRPPSKPTYTISQLAELMNCW